MNSRWDCRKLPSSASRPCRSFPAAGAHRRRVTRKCPGKRTISWFGRACRCAPSPAFPKKCWWAAFNRLRVGASSADRRYTLAAEARIRRSFLSIHVALNHVTHYRYDREVGLSPQVIRLRPAPHCRTRILSYSLKVHPSKHFINWQQDAQANYLARLVFPDRTRELKVEVDMVAE